MCKSPLHPFLAALPKVEHHLHLEGTLSPTFYLELCARNSITPPSSPEFASVAALAARYTSFSSLDDFLHYYGLAMEALITARDFEDLAAAYFARAHAQGVRHAEVFFDPQAHTSRGIALDTVVSSFARAQAAALDRYGLTSALIPCLLRHLPVSSGEETFDALLPEFGAGRLAGLGLCSSEAAFPPELFAGVFRKAGEAGVRRTAHAGEESGPEYVRAALRELGAQRIDHGRTIAHDKELLREMAAQRTLVTLCPLSNVCLKGVGSVAELPVREFLEAGLAFSINSDDPEYFGGYILENYCAVQEAFALSKDEWRGVVKASIEGSWCDEARKGELHKMLEECV